MVSAVTLCWFQLIFISSNILPCATASLFSVCSLYKKFMLRSVSVQSWLWTGRQCVLPGGITRPAHSPVSALKPRWALPRVLPNKDVVFRGKPPSGSHLAQRYHPWDPKYCETEFPRFPSSYKMCPIDTNISDKSSGVFVVAVFVVCCCCFGLLLVRGQLLFAFVLSCPKWEHKLF